jgi:hypothetical protein
LAPIRLLGKSQCVEGAEDSIFAQSKREGRWLSRARKHDCEPSLLKDGRNGGNDGIVIVMIID